MQDKTAIGISDLLRQFIGALVEEVVLEGKPFDDQKKKWLQRYSQEEGLDYAELEKNLTSFFETLEELKSNESKAGVRLAKMLAGDCYLEESKADELLAAMNEARKKEAERIAAEKAKRKAEEEARRKAEASKEEADRKEREEKERKEAERKAKEEAERKAAEERKKEKEKLIKAEEEKQKKEQDAKELMERNYRLLEEKNKEEKQKLIKTFSVNGVSFEMIFVKGGTFFMGAQKDNPYGRNYDSDAEPEESPVHEVTLSDYYIGKECVSQQLWIAVMGSNLSPREDYYAYNITYDEWKKFIHKLCQKTGLDFRMPTEAEWEYAAHGGEKSMWNKYGKRVSEKDDKMFVDKNWTANLNKVWYNFKENELGFVFISDDSELCADYSYNYDETPQVNPIHDKKNSLFRPFYVRKGGIYGGYMRITNRIITPYSRARMRLVLST